MWKSHKFLITCFIIIVTTSVISQELRVESELELGKAINIYMRYGYFSICMRVVPRNDTETWIFREPTVNVFKNLEHFEEPHKNEVNSKQRVFDGDFHMEFCDNLNQLLQAYFRDFVFEKLDKPWKAFTAGWLPEVTGRNLGINSSFVTGDHCFVLVRVARYRQSAKLKDLPLNVDVEDVVSDTIDKLTEGSIGSLENFITKYGTHYISSYVTGNSLYQVFVYSRNVYNRIKERLKTTGVADMSTLELSNYFSPWYAQHVGQIKVASGNRTVESWVLKKLRVHYYIFTYPSLLKLHGDAGLLKTLDGLLGNEAMLQLELKTITPAFKSPSKRRWFEEFIDNNSKLWESNM